MREAWCNELFETIDLVWSGALTISGEDATSKHGALLPRSGVLGGGLKSWVSASRFLTHATIKAKPCNNSMKETSEAWSGEMVDGFGFEEVLAPAPSGKGIWRIIAW